MTDVTVEAFLRVFPGSVFCRACLASMLNRPLMEITAAVDGLGTVCGFEVRRDTCDNCARTAVVCGFIESAA